VHKLQVYSVTCSPYVCTLRGSTHTVRQVLFIGKDEYDGVSHLPVVDDSVQLLASLVDAVAVRAVHHEY
jgi:hypothetical protein